MTTSGTLPMLSGLKIIDVTQFVAGPTASRILAELGADVIKVELAPYGDRSRVQGVKPKDAPENAAPHSTYFFQHNHSKRGIALDFKNERAREILKGMIAKADVLVENFSPGVMARAGMSYEDLKMLSPRLVMCSISFAGQTGDLSEKPGYDYIGQAYAGVTGMIGEADGSPAMVTMAIGDVSTGISAALAIVTALFHRERTGEGQLVESTLLDTYFHMHEASIPRVSKLGKGYVQKRTGWLSAASSDSQAAVRPVAASQSESSVVLPNPAGAEMRNSTASAPRFRRSRSLGRGTTWRRGLGT